MLQDNYEYMNNRSVNEIARESRIHGRKWDNLHDGYFSDPVVAAPFIDEVLKRIEKQPPEIMVDFGGGTGFISSLLSCTDVGSNILYVDIDHSARQLDEACKRNVCVMNRKIHEVKRLDITPEERSLFFLMRSVLHYFGQEGLSYILEHVRRQSRVGEYFIHQSASFEKRHEAHCLNLLYRLMKTDKWYPDRELMCRELEVSGWRVISVLPAPTLLLRSEDLMVRYGLTEKIIKDIIRAISTGFPSMPDIFRVKGDCAFDAELRYMIYTCLAV